MTGTAELRSQDDESKLAVLLERSEQTKGFVEQANKELHALTETTNRIERTLVESTERLFARSEANSLAIKTLDAKVEHKDQSSIARDQQQVGMIRVEETAREAAMTERRRAHDGDISGLRADIKGVSDKVEKLKDRVSDSVTLTRILLFVVAAFAIAVIGAAVTGHLGIVVHP